MRRESARPCGDRAGGLSGTQDDAPDELAVEAGKNHYRCVSAAATATRPIIPADDGECQALGGQAHAPSRVPGSAYPAEALDALIAQARQGDVMMRHGLTGEDVGVSLDGLPAALVAALSRLVARGARSALAQLANGQVFRCSTRRI